jgi:hypothetical protein
VTFSLGSTLSPEVFHGRQSLYVNTGIADASSQALTTSLQYNQSHESVVK